MWCGVVWCGVCCVVCCVVMTSDVYINILTYVRMYKCRVMHMWQAHLETAYYAGSRNSRRKSLKMAVRFPFVTQKQSYVSY